jgi:hypothetical protein
MVVKIIGPSVRNKTGSINTTSSSGWSSGLSPFLLGPVNLYEDFIAQNVENAWQFSKVYKRHVDEFNNPTLDYFLWAINGWADTYAHRYPMGKGAIPEYSYWDGENLDYIEARKRIYIPLYATAVVKTEAFKRLKEIYEENGQVTLFDYDGYDNESLNMTMREVVNNPNRKMGHAFVLKMLLEGDKLWTTTD